MVALLRERLVVWMGWRGREGVGGGLMGMGASGV